MIILAVTEALRARLAAAPAANNPVFSFAFGDDGENRSIGSSKGALNGTTSVDLVGAPASGSLRVIRSGFLYNADSADAEVLIDHFDGTTARPIAQITLKPSYTLTLSDEGFRVTDAMGAEIVPATTPPSDDSSRAVIAFAFGDASPLSLLTVPVDCTDILARIVIDTPFDGAGAQLKLGTAADAEALIPASYNAPATAATYESAPDVSLDSGTEILLTITPGSGATQGAGRVIFDAIAN